MSCHTMPLHGSNACALRLGMGCRRAILRQTCTFMMDMHCTTAQGKQSVSAGATDSLTKMPAVGGKPPHPPVVQCLPHEVRSGGRGGAEYKGLPAAIYVVYITPTGSDDQGPKAQQDQCFLCRIMPQQAAVFSLDALQCGRCAAPNHARHFGKGGSHHKAGEVEVVRHQGQQQQAPPAGPALAVSPAPYSRGGSQYQCMHNCSKRRDVPGCLH